MKKWLLISGITCGAMTLSAVSEAAPYVGFNIGYTSTKVTSHAVGNNINTSDNSSLDGFNGGLLAGYRYKFNFDQFNLAAQANVTGYNASSSAHNSGSATLKESLYYSYGLDLLPGFYIADNVDLYGIVGYQNGTFKFKRSASDNTSYNKTDSLGGYDLGMGTDITLDNNFALSINYKYINYGSDKIKVSGSNFYDKKEPRSNQFLLGILYYFS
ncbi:MAG: hypothetical protein A3E87_06725 [Gammaproteobacteria bacterium RIFCSPHIGHO2_12_FULL_35_23]|nr:MAG: hypothetical protein A3E87_06725 [Gammaproteobacteria bacterium RIFCSPHIGHO2_12_FULL_35_23]